MDFLNFILISSKYFSWLLLKCKAYFINILVDKKFYQMGFMVNKLNKADFQKDCYSHIRSHNKPLQVYPTEFYHLRVENANIYGSQKIRLVAQCFFWKLQGKNSESYAEN